MIWHKKKLKIIFNSKQEFWISIASIKNIHLLEESSADEIIGSLGVDREWGNKFDYEHLNKLENIPVLIDLFKILKVDAVKVLQPICQQIWKTQQ